jgi:hypothetical protein
VLEKYWPLEGRDLCISFDAIDEAFIRARIVWVLAISLFATAVVATRLTRLTHGSRLTVEARALAIGVSTCAPAHLLANRAQACKRTLQEGTSSEVFGIAWRNAQRLDARQLQDGYGTAQEGLHC